MMRLQQQHVCLQTRQEVGIISCQALSHALQAHAAPPRLRASSFLNGAHSAAFRFERTTCARVFASCVRMLHGSKRRAWVTAAADGSPNTSAPSTPGSQQVPVLILPGFLHGSSDYEPVAAVLRKMGHPAAVVPMASWDWAPALRGGSFEWYLERTVAALDALCASCQQQGGARQQPPATATQALAPAGLATSDRTSSSGRGNSTTTTAIPSPVAYADAAPSTSQPQVKVALAGFSAGGWLGRLLLGPAPYAGRSWDQRSRVSALVTLGTPHGSLEAYPFGRLEESRPEEPSGLPADVAGSSLRFTNHFYPTADAHGPGVRMLCVGGEAIRGAAWDWGAVLGRQARGGAGTQGITSGATMSSDRPASAGLVQRFQVAADAAVAASAYAANCGEGGVVGDGVCPLSCAFVEGAERMQLPRVWHTAQHEPWYGSPEVVARWAAWLQQQ